MQSSDRRQFLGKLGIHTGVLGAAGLGGLVVGKASAEAPPAPVSEPAMPPLPWSYTPLDPEMIRRRAHRHYSKGHCCEGAFSAIVGALADAAGHPFDKVPCGMMGYGGGGVAGFGSLCGALNGCGAAINLVCDKKTTEAVLSELMSWYAVAVLPTDISNGYAADGGYFEDDPYTVRTVLPQSVAGDNLCHLSVTRWCKAADLGSGTPERSERCARLTGDVAAKAAELLNAVHAKTFQRAHPVPAQATGCLKCHDLSEKSHTRGKMDCLLCHPPEHKGEHCNPFTQAILQGPKKL